MTAKKVSSDTLKSLIRKLLDESDEYEEDLTTIGAYFKELRIWVERRI